MSEALEQMMALVAAAKDLSAALEALRNETSDDEWDALCDNEFVDAVLCAAMEVESLVEEA